VIDSDNKSTSPMRVAFAHSVAGKIEGLVQAGDIAPPPSELSLTGPASP